MTNQPLSSIDEILDGYKDFVFWKVQANVVRGISRAEAKAKISDLLIREQSKLIERLQDKLTYCTSSVKGEIWVSGYNGGVEDMAIILMEELESLEKKLKENRK